MKWNDAKKIINKDPEVIKELKNLKPEYQVIKQLIEVRKDMNLTQKELAKKQ